MQYLFVNIKLRKKFEILFLFSEPTHVKFMLLIHVYVTFKNLKNYVDSILCYYK